MATPGCDQLTILSYAWCRPLMRPLMQWRAGKGEEFVRDGQVKNTAMKRCVSTTTLSIKSQSSVG
ncbi:hypothetical protein TPAR_00273 [Tolypocladium paradoxum]|uniref:Uncharacterized protein n=1 Tax=Tolypocladium paradoxum TaxID=94208 RepID=A0A2S4LAR6_9HYPO|nr:hypothetical protein TPAR_00273 [Tolypocladium paradoxum]